MNGRHSLGGIPSFSTELVPDTVTTDDEIEALLARITEDHAAEGSTLPAQMDRLRGLIAQRDADYAQRLAEAGSQSLRQTLLAGLAPVATVLFFAALVLSLKDLLFGNGACANGAFTAESRTAIETAVGGGKYASNLSVIPRSFLTDRLCSQHLFGGGTWCS